MVSDNGLTGTVCLCLGPDQILDSLPLWNWESGAGAYPKTEARRRMFHEIEEIRYSWSQNRGTVCISRQKTRSNSE